MASTKILVVVVLAAFAVQCFAGEVHTNDKHNDRSLNDTFMKVIRKVQAAIEKGKQEASKGLDIASSEVIKALDIAKDKITMVNDEIMEELNDLEETGTAANISVAECIEGNKDLFKQKLENVNKNIDVCGKVATDGIESVKVQLEKVMGDFNKHLDDLTEQFKACKNNNICAIAIITKFTLEAPELILEILGAAKDITETALETSADGIKCIGGTVEEYAKETKVIIEKVRECCKEKLEENKH